jgi:hypothetical protein
MVYSAPNIHEISCKNTIDGHSKKGLKALPTTLGGKELMFYKETTLYKMKQDIYLKYRAFMFH